MITFLRLQPHFYFFLFKAHKCCFVPPSVLRAEWSGDRSWRRDVGYADTHGSPWFLTPLSQDLVPDGNQPVVTCIGLSPHAFTYMWSVTKVPRDKTHNLRGFWPIATTILLSFTLRNNYHRDTKYRGVKTWYWDSRVPAVHSLSWSSPFSSLKCFQWKSVGTRDLLICVLLMSIHTLLLSTSFLNWMWLRFIGAPVMCFSTCIHLSLQRYTSRLVSCLGSLEHESRLLKDSCRSSGSVLTVI